MEIEKILIEHRPRLQSVNIFISFNSQINSVQSVKISLRNEEIQLLIEDTYHYCIKFENFFSLQTQTLSLLNVSQNNLSFRLNTNESSFTSELLYVNGVALNNNFRLGVNLSVGEQYKIVCANCQNRLSKETVQFSRILELPSDNLDMGDWFCCKHSHGDTKLEEPAAAPPCVDDSITEKFNSSRFAPKSEDLFYGNYFAIFNQTLFDSIRKSKNESNSSVFCQRCCQPLGEQILRTNSLKVWNENLKFIKIDESQELRLFECSNIFDNFLFIIGKYLNDFTFETYMGLPNIFKIVFETKLAGGSQNFLLLQIMDKNLDILQLKAIESNFEAQTSFNVTLRRGTTMKIMYKLIDVEHLDDGMLKFWQNDSNVNELQISMQMFKVVLNNLDANSTFIPECYRHNSNFTLSYLNL